MQRRAQRIEPADLARIRAVLDAHASASTEGKRLRAVIMLAHAAALELSELLALELRHVLDPQGDHPWSIRAPAYLPLRAGKTAIMPAHVEPHLRAWIKAAAKHYAIQLPPKPRALLFVQVSNGRISPLSPRTLQWQFQAVQHEARLAALYRFSDLRFDAVSRYAESTRSVQLVAQFARVTEHQALAYLPKSRPATLAELAANRT